ncbi:hypothetical protein RFI_08626 [Reticulomyxa filosa]|uniref:RING-type domain-containing protein n=1 Tax=Reticulomyxa filosa TaxID=46433 RepID=X6NT73_RETFI|nr:hypothetical protein RFI_08626 [Reticulomyxa filosa]|eukprot:ETO28507.1 hypothetical protein RFI_08626 [Reticulomyxa filosa]
MAELKLLKEWLTENNLFEPEVLKELSKHNMTVEAILEGTKDDIREICEELRFTPIIKLKFVAAYNISRAEKHERTINKKPKKNSKKKTSKKKTSKKKKVKTLDKEVKQKKSNITERNQNKDMAEAESLEYAYAIQRIEIAEHQSYANTQAMPRNGHFYQPENIDNRQANTYTNERAEHFYDRSFSSEQIGTYGDNQSLCNICLEVLEIECRVKTPFMCKCKFHTECIDKWIEIKQRKGGYNANVCPLHRSH